MGHHDLSADLMRARYAHALAHYRLHGQREVSALCRKIVRAHHQRRGRAASVADGPNWKLWRALGESGLLQVVSGGARMRPSPLVWMTIMQEFGESLVAEPFIETVVGAGELIHRLGSSSQREMLLAQIADGAALWAVAHQEFASGNELTDVVTTARPVHNGYLIQGAKAAVAAAPWASRFIVSARTSGARREAAGVSLFVVESRNRGVRLDWTKADEGTCVANLTLSNVYVDAGARLSGEGEAFSVMESSRAKWIAALCAEAVGAIAGLMAIVRRNATLLAATTRPPGRWNDMLAAHEDAAALTQHFSARLSVEAGVDPLLVSRIKSQVGYAARFVLEEARRLIEPGSPDGPAVARYGQRILTINGQHGDPDFHHRRVCGIC